MPSLLDHDGGPFSGRVSFREVAERIESVDLGDEPATMRERFARLVLGDGSDRPPHIGTPAQWGGVEGRTVSPSEGEGGGARVVWFHGGGYVFGSPATHGRPAAALAERLGVPVVLPRYRLAPDDPWPAPRDDALAAVRAVRTRAGASRSRATAQAATSPSWSRSPWRATGGPSTPSFCSRPTRTGRA